MAKLIECLAAQVERYRKQKRLSQEALGKLVGLSKQAIWNIEHAKTGSSFETISKLASALSVEETDLTSSPRKVASGDEFQNELVEFVREAKNEREFYRSFMERVSENKGIQWDPVKKLVKEVTLKPEDIDEEAKVPPVRPSISLEALEGPALDELLTLFSSFNDEQKRKALVALQSIKRTGLASSQVFNPGKKAK